MSKKNLGQFNTTNYRYILDGFNPPTNCKFIEPFVGSGCLLPFIPNNEVECYDIEPRIEKCAQRDTILEPPDYNGKYVITNPPFLARNKSGDKRHYEMYKQNDLYKCFLITLIQSNPIGGILILPLNFFCSVRTTDVKLRDQFLSKFKIIKMNWFEEQVFEDTTYNVCSFMFETSSEKLKKQKIQIGEMNITIKQKYGWMIGGKIYHLKFDDEIQIKRITTTCKHMTFILINCVDLAGQQNILASFEPNVFVGKNSDRTKMSVEISPTLSIKKQKKLVKQFNGLITDYRQRYNSLFLPNFRDNGRKRIPFTLVFDIMKFILTRMASHHQSI